MDTLPMGHLKSTHFSSSLTYEFHNFDKELYGHNNHALFFPHMCGNREEFFLKILLFLHIWLRLWRHRGWKSHPFHNLNSSNHRDVSHQKWFCTFQQEVRNVKLLTNDACHMTTYEVGHLSDSVDLKISASARAF